MNSPCGLISANKLKLGQINVKKLVGLGFAHLVPVPVRFVQFPKFKTFFEASAVERLLRLTNCISLSYFIQYQGIILKKIS